MAYILRTESLDDDPEEREFATKEEAIDAAAQWFLGGYEENIDHWERARIAPDLEKEVAQLRRDLEAGREFWRS